MLAELLQRTTGQRFQRLIADELFTPLEISHTTCGWPGERIDNGPEMLATMAMREKGELVVTDWHRQPRVNAVSPGSNFRGPVRELGQFYEMLLADGDWRDTPVLPARAVREMRRRHRVDMFDETLRHRVDMGLGVIVDSKHHGPDTLPYGFGRYASPESFGHSGIQSSIGFADPASRLVVAWVANGLPGEPKHQKRARLINEAIYSDLGLSD